MGAAEWVQLIVVLFGTGGAGWGIFKGLRKTMDDWSARKFRNEWRADNLIWRELRSLRVNLKAKRALLLKTCNGGGIPRAGISEVYCTIMKETVADEESEIGQDWQQWKIDEPYRELVCELAEHGHVHLISTEMPRSSALRDMYISKGIEASDVYSIGLARDGADFVYISLHFGEKGRALDAGEREQVRKSIDVMYRLMNKYNRILEMNVLQENI